MYYLGSYYTFLYDILRATQHHIGYTLIADTLLNDLALMRIVEPASKLRSITLMENYFGIAHRRQRYYESAPKWLALKQTIERQTLRFARKHYGYDFSMVFYDVTTLYFESFTADELRKTGFSKDGKAQQPQILVALLVTPQGFPVGYHVFSGNTFEGHTLIPVIKDFIKKHKVKHFTVVADAAMISNDNIKALRQEGVHYIVGARLGNISSELLTKIDRTLKREDGNNIRLKTDNSKPSLNEELISKTKMLLGVKGYYTDIKANVVNNTTIIKNYHELYRVEQAFRVSKSDLRTRPIFHFKSHTIQLHIMICFMALVVSKHIEIKTGLSIRAFVTQCKSITDARLINQINNKEIKMRVPITKEIQKIIAKLNLPH